MKNKALVFAGLCTLALCASQVQAVNHETNPIYYNEVDNLPTGYTSIDLHAPFPRSPEFAITSGRKMRRVKS